MRLERQLHRIVYWLLGIALFIGALILVAGLANVAGLAVLFFTASEHVADGVFNGIIDLFKLLGPLAAITVATKGRYGRWSLTNFLITLIIVSIPVVGFFAMPFYVGRGLWMLVTRQEPIIGIPGPLDQTEEGRRRGGLTLTELSKRELSQLKKVLPDPGDWLEREGKWELLLEEMGPEFSRETLALRLPTTRAYREYAEHVVPIMESLVRSRPREWIYWHKLGECYQTIGELARSVRACEKCYELRPKDPRSAYALATALRVLTRAKYVGDLRIEGVKKRMAKSGFASIDDFNPEESQKALQELGMTVDQAAERSLTVFEEVLTAGVRGQEAQHVEDCLAVMYPEFPHLEARVKSTRQAPRGLLAEARGDPFNQAAGRYRKLRYLMGRPDQYKRELVEIIRLCQMAIAKNRRNGDAFVLLANALSLAASEVLGDDEAHDYFLTRAAAVIQHWASSGLYTRNRDIGLQLLQGIKDRIRRAKALTPTELERRMEALRNTLLPDVLRPDSLTKMQQMLTVDRV